jgi:hypothetical protein
MESGVSKEMMREKRKGVRKGGGASVNLVGLLRQDLTSKKREVTQASPIHFFLTWFVGFVGFQSRQNRATKRSGKCFTVYLFGPGIDTEIHVKTGLPNKALEVFPCHILTWPVQVLVCIVSTLEFSITLASF